MPMPLSDKLSSKSVEMNPDFLRLLSNKNTQCPTEEMLGIKIGDPRKLPRCHLHVRNPLKGKNPKSLPISIESDQIPGIDRAEKMIRLDPTRARTAIV